MNKLFNVLRIEIRSQKMHLGLLSTVARAAALENFSIVFVFLISRSLCDLSFIATTGKSYYLCLFFYVYFLIAQIKYKSCSLTLEFLNHSKIISCLDLKVSKTPELQLLHSPFHLHLEIPDFVCVWTWSIMDFSLFKLSFFCSANF